MKKRDKRLKKTNKNEGKEITDPIPIPLKMQNKQYFKDINITQFNKMNN